MTSDISKPPPPSPPPPPPEPTQTDAARGPEQVQEAAAKADISKTLQPTLTTAEAPPAEQFVGVVDTIYIEAAQYLQQSSPTIPAQKMQEMQTEMQWVRELVKEIKELTLNRGMELQQALHHIKVEQGGQFWQKILQVLQKGAPGGDVAFQFKGNAADKVAELQAQRVAMEGQAGAELAERGKEVARRFPGGALLEMLRAETNPKGETAHFLLALELLRRDGYDQSSQRLLSYLRRRNQWDEEEFLRYFGSMQREIFQGPLPRDSEGRAQSWIYIALSILIVPLAAALGFSVMEGILAAVALAFVLAVVMHVFK